MKKRITALVLALGLAAFSGCDQIDTGTIREQVETMASQVDLEGMVTKLIDSIDWEELKASAEKGYNALMEEYPALKQENISAYLKDNGLKLMKELVGRTDEASRESAGKLGAIIKILYPDLSDEVDAVIGN